jgi:catechol 2,3-dioxygenase-like lactoylglutathione lyase family enzyme
MPINKLAHFSVRTNSLDASLRFYCEVLDLHEGFRPPFSFPGAWLYRSGDPVDFGVVHLIGVDMSSPCGLADYLGDKPLEGLQGSGAVDHMAFLATNLPDMYLRLHRAGLVFRERTVPSLGLHQVFVEDPSGVTIELNFPAKEAEALVFSGASSAH